MAPIHISQRRLFRPANVDGQGATGVKSACVGEMECRGHIPGDRVEFLTSRRAARQALEQPFRVGMEEGGENLR